MNEYMNTEQAELLLNLMLHHNHHMQTEHGLNFYNMTELEAHEYTRIVSLVDRHWRTGFTKNYERRWNRIDEISSHYNLMLIWTASRNQQPIREVIDQHYGIELYELHDRDTAVIAAENIIDRQYRTLNSCSRETRTPNTVTTGERYFPILTVEDLMRYWEQHSWENNRPTTQHM